MRHLVFDVNVILNLFLQRGDTAAAQHLADKVLSGEVVGWVAAQSLPIIEYLLRRQLKDEGADPEEAKRIASDALAWLCEHFQLLSLPGDEARDALARSRDAEDAQIALAATALEGDVCIVTEDQQFDTLGLVPACSPHDLLLQPETTGRQPIPVLDLAPEQRRLLPKLERRLRHVLKSSQFIMGPEVKAFEEEAAEYLGVKHAIGVNSGTDALVIGLRALGIGPGDEVITTPFSFFATAEAISNVGAKPVFVDIDEESFNLNPDLIEAAITERTRAIMPVHLYGRPAEMDAILDLARRHDLKVIEDCAQSFGARYSGKHTGTLGEVGAYSFFPSKNLGAYGDGGLIVTDDDALAEHMRMLRVHGAKKKYHNEMLGYNSRLDSLQAAILRVKLPHIDSWNEGRRRAAATYNELLEGIKGVVPPTIVEGHVFHQYTVRLPGAERDAVQKRLKDAGVGSMVYYPTPQDRLPIYQGQYPENPVSDKLAQQVLSLPIWPELSADEQEHVVATLLQTLQATKVRGGA